ncbi:MAG TPA: dephospho-CoA kinase [Gemmatimonadales bacterium]|jgi:dephospho-CoA kinase
MLKVALTGNAAAGKSTVLEFFRRWGAPVSDADQFAREAVAKGSPGLARVAERFGPRFIQADGSLDRGAMRRHVLADPKERAALEAIIHPIVAELAAGAETRIRASGAPLMVYDVPLLFEALNPDSYDAVVLVDAPEETRRARLESRGLSRADADALMAAQQPAASKRARSRFVIENGGSLQTLEARARTVWSGLQEMAGTA